MKSRQFIILIITIIFCFGNKVSAFPLLDGGETDKYLPSDSIFAGYLHERGIPIYNNNEIELLPYGRINFENLFEAIRNAKEHIHLGIHRHNRDIGD